MLVLSSHNEEQYNQNDDGGDADPTPDIHSNLLSIYRKESPDVCILAYKLAKC